MDTTYKLQLKIGIHEFCAEGPVEVVKHDFELWKTMLLEIPAAPVAGMTSGANEVQATNRNGGLPPKEQIDKLFLSDDKRGMVTLRILPRSDDRNAEVLLLLVFGYRALMNMDEVAVTLLRPSLRQSGCTIQRVDQIAAKFVRQGFLNKGGRGKGGKYSLTNSGLDKASAIVAALASS